jgi:hypothetical protein
MTSVKGQVLAISDRGITVSPLVGNSKGDAFGLPFRANLHEGQFVEILLHPSGQRAEWPRTG